MVLDFNVSELITFVISLVVFSAAMFDAIRMRVKVRRIQAIQVQTEVNNMILTAQLDQITADRDATNIEQSDGFLKFVSDSRDWAFQYIEDIQAALNEYDAALHSKNAVEINNSYKKLIDFLPKSEDMIS